MGNDLSDLAMHPFTRGQAVERGVLPYELRQHVETHQLRRLLQGVYVGADVPDSVDLRVAALRLVVPPDAVITDETAGWLHGAPMILEPNSDAVVPDVHVFQTKRGCRLRNGLTQSGERGLTERDVVRVGSLLATSPLRTACDLARLRPRFAAIAALDQLLALGEFTKGELIAEAARFRGFRGVIQLRALSRVADHRAASPPESAMRLCWIEAGLPAPTPQLPVEAGEVVWALDLGLETLRFGAEYDGIEFHTLRADRRHDADRRGVLEDDLGWLIAVLRRKHLYGRKADPHGLLRAKFEEARRTVGDRRTRWLG